MMRDYISPTTLAKILITAGIAVLLLFRMDWGHVGEMTSHLQVAAWTGALGVMAVQIFLLAWRWESLCDDGEMTYPRALNVTLAALLSNLLLITSISGVFVRVALSVQYGMGWVKAGCAAIADRLMTMFALVILAALLMPGLSQFIPPHLYKSIALSLAVFIGTCGILVPLFFAEKLQALLARHNKAKEIRDYIRDLLVNPAQAACVVILSLVAQAAYFIAVYIIARATGADISFSQLMSVLPVIALVASLPLSFGGWGIREGAFIYGLGLLGVSMETAFLISVQIGLLSMLAVAATALPVLALSRTGRAFVFNPRAAFQAINRAS